MNKWKNNLDKFYIALGTVLLGTALVLTVHKTVTLQEQKDYLEARGEIVVIFNKEISEGELRSLIDQYDTSVEIVQHIEDYALLFVSDASTYKSILNSLEDTAQVLAAEANYGISTMSFTNDPFADTQWYIDNPGHYIYLNDTSKYKKSATQGIDMDVLEAWESIAESGLAKREVVVAVIDTGIDYTHPDLSANMWVNEDETRDDLVDNDNNGYIDDYLGWDFYNKDASICHYDYNVRYKKDMASSKDNDDHGTHVAGIIGAVANNSTGIAGIASNINIKIMSLKINVGQDGTGSISGAIEAIKYATMMGADICNLSWGTSQYAETLEQIMKESDMLFIAAAGNTGSNNDDKPIYPASMELDNLISVTFINSKGELTELSNYGTDSVDLAAPGEDIYSTIVGSYLSMSGSSMAAPQVSAIAAILYAYNDNLYPANVKEILLHNMKPLPDLEERLINAGIPSAYKAVKAADTLIQDIDPPEMSFETIYNKGEMTIPIYAKDKGDSQIRVLKWIFGDKAKEEFHRGVNGTSVAKNRISVAKAGIYTFYAADYAGNEIIQTYEVLEDIKVPKVTNTFTVADSYKSRTVTVKASDLQSGLKRIKYMSGIKSTADFLPTGSGTDIELQDGKGTFKVKQDGYYTIFASDNRGNLVVKSIVIKTVKATDIKFAQSKKTIYLGEQYNLRAYVRPFGTTDKTTYASSDETVAIITSRGKITALSEGKAYITARTSSGFTAVCVITVREEE